ncbi:N-acetylglucosaminidase [Ammoniphilus oxalaticus]|nr:glucosaminidase domain-containing protein [Ammoniphilus oxalaticus]
MNKTTVMIAILFLVTAIAQQLQVTPPILLGQAFSKELIATIMDQPIDEQYEQLKQETGQTHLVAEAKHEKLLLDNTSASRVLLLQQELADKRRQFRQEAQSSDVTTLDLRKPSGLSAGEADRLLAGTGLEGLGKAFVEAENDYEVNAYYLIAHAAWESGWGNSKISREKNNLFGFMAYDNSPYQSAKHFKTKAEGIDVVAKFISQNYLQESGRYYHGPTLKGMNVRYASDGNWNRGIAKVIRSLVNKPVNDPMIA